MLTSALPALLAAALLASYAFWIYLRRDLPVRPARWLALMRASALVLLVLLLWNPSLPAGASTGGAVTWVGIDASRSMAAGGAETAWDRALDIARSAGNDARVALLHDPAGAPSEPDSLRPGAETSALAPFLRRATEAGAAEIRIVSDLRLDDAVAVAAELERPGPPVDVIDVGTELPNAGIADVLVPDAVRSAEEATVGVEVFATDGAAGSPARVTLARDGEEVAAWDVTLPGPGTVVRRETSVAFPDSAGPVRWTATVALDGDAFPDDDRRTRITEVDPAAGIVALVSLSPGWEPRFLLPVLGEVSGLPARGWLALGEDRFLPMGGGPVVNGSVLRGTLEDARIVVVDGIGASAPAWITEVVEAGARVIALPSDPAGAAVAGVVTGPARPGEWYVTAPPPPSPLSGPLIGVEVDGLPPLTRLLAVEDSAIRPALSAERAGGGEGLPALVLVERPDRRAVVALGSGIWRWAFRPGEARDAYRRVWSAAVGWLLDLGEGRALAGVAPDALVAAADRPLGWLAPDAAGGRIEVAIDSTGIVVRVDTLEVGPDGAAEQPPLGPGSWSWRVRVLEAAEAAPDPEARTWIGPLVTERWTDELRPPRVEVPARSARALEAAARADGLPLRTTPWPWLLVLALVCAEWIGRRRSGLR